jgi:mitogen-activated protein kinase kinase 1 interacting protein 1
MMAEELKKYFNQLMKMIEGVHAIIITDREGVPLLQVRDESLPEYATRASVLATSSATIEQGSKIGLGQTKTVTAMFSTHQLVCFNRTPLIVTVWADRSANTGHILSLEQQLLDVVSELRPVVDTVI